SRWPFAVSLPEARSLLRPDLVDEVERCLGGAPEPREACLLRELAHPCLPRLRSERGADLLRERGWAAVERRSGIEDAPDRIQVLLHRVVGERPDEHPGSVATARPPPVHGRADGATHA